MSKKNIYQIETGEFGDLKYWNDKGYGYDLIKASVKSGKPCRNTKKTPSHTFSLKSKENCTWDIGSLWRGKTGSFKGKHHSEETKQRLREANTGRRFHRRDFVIPEDEVALVDIPFFGRSAYDNICRYEGITIYTHNYQNQRILSIKKADLESLRNHKFNLKGSSKWEQEVFDKFPESIKHCRTLIKPLELDMYFEKEKVAVELDGLFYHSERTVDRNYHLLKTNLCKDKGVRLIHIFEDEWKTKPEIVTSIINSALGRYERKIYARKCTVKDVDKKEANEFLERNHIQGKSQFHKAIGLYFEGELVQLITLRNNPFKKGELELARMCSLLNTQVIGGFSKLLKNLKLKGGVVSYVDLRLFNANGYLNSGWKILGQTKPGYHYTDGIHRFNRMKFMKNKIADWEGETEVEKCRNRGLFRIFDCGCLKVYYLYPSSVAVSASPNIPTPLTLGSSTM